jgi:raffinose/stachyose/melibiose transport system permease protein
MSTATQATSSTQLRHKKRSPAKLAIFIIGLVLSIVYVMPFFLVFVNSFKPKTEILTNPLALPIVFTWDNFNQAMTKMNFWVSITNSAVVTIFGVSTLILISSMLAYYLSRNPNKFTKTVFMILVASMIVPFQALMIPFVGLFAPLVDGRNIPMLIFFYMGFGTSLSTFLYHGFISNIPKELDEAASIDGAGDMTIFWRIIFPMLRPVTATVAIINALWIWNDYLLPRLVLTTDTQTLPLSTYLFYGQYSTEYGQAMAGLLLAVIPIIFFYLILQRQFISGISSGAVK